jgi:hypothetical protein
MAFYLIGVSDKHRSGGFPPRLTEHKIRLKVQN